MTTRWIAVAVVCLSAVSSWSCGGGTETAPCVGTCGTGEVRAKGAFLAKPGTDVSGTVEITEDEGPARVVVEVAGLTPGAYGVHIHEKGVCDAPDFTTAGGHFNPTGAPHACPPTEPRHAGDLGNIHVGSNGRGLLEMAAPDITLREGTRSVVGLSVILHAHEDDCATQPAGDSGMRAACAILEPE